MCLSSFSWRAGSLEITAKGQVQIRAFAEAGSADLSQLDVCGEAFTRQTQDGEHIDLALSELLPSKLHRLGAARNRVGQRAFAFAHIVIAGESVFHIFECAQRSAHVASGGGFLFGGAKILRSFKFTTEENWLRDPGGETPDDGIQRAD